jgi:hypothetical protein
LFFETGLERKVTDVDNKLVHSRYLGDDRELRRKSIARTIPETRDVPADDKF